VCTSPTVLSAGCGDSNVLEWVTISQWFLEPFFLSRGSSARSIRTKFGLIGYLQWYVGLQRTLHKVHLSQTCQERLSRSFPRSHPRWPSQGQVEHVVAPTICSAHSLSMKQLAKFLHFCKIDALYIIRSPMQCMNQVLHI
jgi:hypothetical protein